MNAALQKKVRDLPASAGVYLMHDALGEIFYIGKAKSLRHRWRSYLSGADPRRFVGMLGRILADVEVVLTATEKEALILENELIKIHQPKFNVKLVDDKQFLRIRLDLQQRYPRVVLVRNFQKDNARYFGPYHSAASIRETVRIINRYFQLRTCSDAVLKARRRPCLQYQIKRCPAPCVFDIEAEYAEHIRAVVSFLEGKKEALQHRLKERMDVCAQNLAFEEAAILRDQIRAIQRSLERQRVVQPKDYDSDAIGLHREGPAIEIHVARTRKGRLVDARRYSLTGLEQPTGEILADFGARYYSTGDGMEQVPGEILFPSAMQWHEALSELLSERCGRKVRVGVPKRGDKLQCVVMADKNAQQAFEDKQRRVDESSRTLEDLRRTLHLLHSPVRIECVDVSHTQGAQIVASVVRFEHGHPLKNLYRTYKLKTLNAGQDDFQAIYEVMNRRARRGLEESDLPDLMIIDGGKGQLGAARAAFEDHGIDGVELVGLAKARAADAQRKHAVVERVFVHGHKNPIIPKHHSAALFLLMRVRDEAHRFAIAYHRKLRRKAATQSVLDSIAGIGPKRRRALLQRFGSVEGVRKATEVAIAEVVGPLCAQAVVKFLRQS